MDNLLTNKTAIVYGAGAIGSAVATAFVAAGATVYVADRHAEALQKLASDTIHTKAVDVLDKDAVEQFVASVAEQTGRVDISFCATSTHKPGGEQGAALAELSYEDFAMPMQDYTKAQFNTINAATPYMVEQKSGVLLAMTAVPSHIPYPYTAGFGVAWAAVESMMRLAAAELGQHGIRAVCLHSAGSQEAAASVGKTMTTTTPDFAARAAGWGELSAARSLLPGKSPSLKEVGDMATFMASDLAGATTGTLINLNCGMVNN